MIIKTVIILVGVFSFLSCFVVDVAAQKKAKLGKVCGDPTARCATKNEFQPFDLPFQFGNGVIADSEYFYAIIIKSVKNTDDSNCETIISENERLAVQKLFPQNKVFAYKCFETGWNFYTNVKNGVSFMAIYAGKSLPEANKFLKSVQQLNKFGNLSLRRMQIGINGT
jgi:hypothetical protein